MRKRFTPKSRQAWRSWLEERHGTESEVWLIFYKVHTGKPTLTYNDAVEEALCFGWIDGVRRRIDDERYAHRFSPRRPASRWSATNRKRVQRMEKAGLMTPAGRRMTELAKKRGTWETSERQPAISLEMPAELAAKLQRNRKAAEFFDSLARSYRQQFIGWINSAKREETRKRRVAETLELLTRGEKLGMR